MNKITIVGAGRVGEAAAHFIAKAELCRELLLLDIRDGAASGAALDIQESAPLFSFDTLVRGGSEATAMAGSELVIITAGVPRKPGMSRSDVLNTNISVIDGIVDDILEHCPQAMILVVSNPVDVLTFRAWQRSGLPRRQVFGQAGVLDSGRMASFIALETGFSSRDINAMVLGGHGDAMVPLIRYSTVAGIPLEHFLDHLTIKQIIERTRNGGAEILALRQTSSAYDAPAAAIATMVDAIVKRRRRILPTVAILQGEYGHKDIATGVPCILSSPGMEKVVELRLNGEEQELFDRSLAAIRRDISRLPGN